jgi:hypothetical protein
VNKMLTLIAESHIGPLQIYASSGECGSKQVRDLWEAASFLVQMYGLFLNTRITIRYGRLGIDDPSKAGPLLTSLMHELRMLITGRAASAGCLA